ncbi:e65e15e7-e58f-4bd6-a05a-23b24e3531a6 [Sclerotinia trifoliorum]|uniref:E65e15e7-e58f-4bd6-a05a-23b24e3531a6 n=1 Tax=Sclerotinia trifoliorum TaxID=28548 RepID=A0A8H2W132_9HELO|nr:e65e15e7-e58f-4bd6-a05a-23b24e3531a6 [Sclerotinia trifoliorum]
MAGLSPSQVEELLQGPALNPPLGVIPNFDNSYTLLPVANAVKIVTTILATLAIFIRIYTKWRIIREMHLEDYIAVAAWGGYIVFIVTTGFDPKVFGRHQWNIRLVDFQIFLYGTYISSISFGLAILSIKISILLQYIRIFTAGTRDLMFWSCHALMWMTVVFYVILLFMTIFLCTPVPKFWNVLETGHCLNMNYVFLATGTANTISDFLIILLPQPIIWRLQMSFKEHVGVSAIFSTGLLACIASMVRLIISSKLLKNNDVTWLTSIMCIPSYVELGAGIITSCLPTLPRFFKTMAQIPWVSKMCISIPSCFKPSKSSTESKKSSERNITASWVRNHRRSSRLRVERRVLSESYDGLDEWEGNDAVFSITRLGNVTISTGIRNEGNNLEVKNLDDEERGVLKSVQVSVVRQGSEHSEGSNL